MPASFLYVRIPPQLSEAVEEIKGDTSGGLTDDFVITNARKYFAKSADKEALASQIPDIDKLEDSQKKQLASQLREQIKGQAAPGVADNLANLSDDVILSMYKASTAPGASNSCEIIALTVPTEGNQRKAVSMYANNNAKEDPSQQNLRAMALMQGCGHQNRTLYGDVFVARCHDDEMKDIWTRVDFTKEDISPESEWCRSARASGGGGGTGSSSAHSLSNSMTKTLGGMPQMVSSADGGAAASQQPSPSMDGTEIRTDEYAWSQTDDEVEVKFTAPAGTKGKQVKIKFQRKSIEVKLLDKTVLEGKLGGTIIVDDSTYTLQDASDNNRELCLTMAKDSPGSLWLGVVVP
eukprot:CAMPEP_0198126772 /NCGR_PEP_ID=MMETSP1442-20131203/45694_1 /TAXON_ID= /ORGANISM="Craspedostauros australis, Strain CCMP3328" /LENGTH=349 /DNA_ID=CAMNT_0043786643 /DNA_START=13 /DNA_END=1062 /DNA_ORIENTATION=-